MNISHLRASAIALGPMTAAERAKGRYMRDATEHPASPEAKSVEQLAKEVRAEFDKRLDEVKAVAADAIAKAERGEKLLEDEKTRADEAMTNFNGVKARLDDVEQKLARQRAVSGGTPQTPGYKFIEDEAVKQFMANPQAGRRVTVDVKTTATISGDTAVAAGAAGDLVVPDRGEIITPSVRRLTVRDLLTPGRTSASSIQYPVETGFTNAAAAVAEAAAKPQGDLSFDIRTSAVTTIAHWVLATRQILDDAPMLQSYIDGRLRYGLAYAEEVQLLHGDGTGVNLNGIYTQAIDIGDMGIVATPQKLDVLRMAMLKASLAEYPSTGMVLHPTDWAGIELTKDTQGRYIIGDPKSDAPSRLWGLPVVATQAMLLGKFLVGAFRMGAQIFDRENASVELSTEDSDNFRKNLVTILAEERLALAVYRPTAFVKGDFAAAITALTT
jgi:HK97 family phage major capsid protein